MTSDELAQRPQRAPSMPPDERRASIVSATVALLLEHGAMVTTKQIAEAAGIAEGTIFRVFADKDALIAAAVDSVFDPAPAEVALAAIDPSLGFEGRLAAGVEIMQRRMRDIWKLGAAGLFDNRPKSAPADFEGIVAIFRDSPDRVSRTPVQAAQMLRALTLAFSHPLMAPNQPLTADEIVAVLLDGIRS